MTEQTPTPPAETPDEALRKMNETIVQQRIDTERIAARYNGFVLGFLLGTGMATTVCLVLR